MERQSGPGAGSGSLPPTFSPDEGGRLSVTPNSAPEVHFRHLLVGLHAGELHASKRRDARIVNQAP